ncbi:MAG TPA: hypothetical protein VMT21_11145 [Gemmatimonadales bacterium]|nr:hypothetical protein [Gemmatimonadales bacterium]
MAARKKPSRSAAKRGYRKAAGSKDPHAHYHGSRKHSHPHKGAHRHR